MTISQKLHTKIRHYVHSLQRYVNRPWYPALIALLAALDNLVLVVPTDGILISSSMILPKRWLLYAASISVGSTIGAVALASLVELHGLPWVMEMYPGINETHAWEISLKFFERFGLILVFVVAATPLMQQPTIILASLANTPIFTLAWVVFCGRLIKFLIMAYVGSHAPRLLNRLWGVQGELKDAGIDVTPRTDL